MNIFGALYGIIFLLLAIYTFGFVDGNLTLSTHSLYVQFHEPLKHLVFGTRPVAGILYGGIVAVLWILYAAALRTKALRWSKGTIVCLLLILLLSFPAFSYDIFNYIATSRVTFHYGENPWLVMPIEIPNEPMLAYTRAANKLALYGPSWILMTGVPYIVGMGNIWATIIAMKVMIAVFFIGIAWLIYRQTKRREDVWYFVLNPLVLIEVLVSGHNDVFMMFLALGGLVLVAKKDMASKVLGWISWGASVLVKGATVVLVPVLLMKDPLSAKSLRISYWLLFVVFLVSPLREEMYPWYALWLVPFAAFLTKDRFIRGFTLALTLGLSFRHLHYIYTGEYGGSGPLYRSLVTAVPVLLYLVWYKFRNK